MPEKSRKKTIIFTIAILGIMLLIGFIFRMNATNKTASKSGFYFDTIIQIKLYDSGDEKLIDECFEKAEYYENLFSRTKDTSDIYKINHSNGEPVKVANETIELISKSLAYCESTDGILDITVGSLSELWDISTASLTGSGVIPDDNEIISALSTVDYRCVSLDETNNTVTVTNGAILDLGAFAKGYVADEMKKYLNDKGVHTGIINLGGNTLTLGEKSGGKKYTIGIQEPFSEDGTTITTLQVTDKSVVTSGCYQRYFKVDDKIYHHILDTKTGFPVDNDLYSVTIISDSSLEGDALSTYVYSLGLDEGQKYIESRNDINAVFIDKNLKIHTCFN